MTLRYFVPLCVLFSLSCSHSRSKIDKESPQDWTVIWKSRAEIEHGDKVIEEREDITIIITAQTKMEISESTTAPNTPKSKTTKSEKVNALPDTTRDQLIALLPQLQKIPGTYALSPYVDNEGTYFEEIIVQIGKNSFDFPLKQGLSYPKPPNVVAKLYRLIRGVPLPTEVNPNSE